MTLIVGGGLAGASLAVRLAEAGHRVTLIERTAAPHDTVCGEFLSPEAQLYLDQIGVNVRALGAVPIRRVRVEAYGAAAETTLPFVGASLTRRVLDEAVLDRAAEAGAVIRRGAAVRDLARTTTGWRVRLDDGERIEAETAVLATGKRDLRGWPRGAGVQGDLVAFKLIADGPADRPATTGLILFRDGYGGIQPIEGGRITLCLVIRKRRLHDLGGGWAALARALARELPAHAALFGHVAGARPVALAGIPYGYLRWRSEGLWRIGDQAAVIPSFTGDGMAMALHGAALAAVMIGWGAAADAFQGRLARDLSGPLRRAVLLSLLLVRAPIAAALVPLAGIAPTLIRAIARGTRIPAARLQAGKSSVSISAWTAAE